MSSFCFTPDLNFGFPRISGNYDKSLGQSRATVACDSVTLLGSVAIQGTLTTLSQIASSITFGDGSSMTTAVRANNSLTTLDWDTVAYAAKITFVQASIISNAVDEGIRIQLTNSGGVAISTVAMQQAYGTTKRITATAIIPAGSYFSIVKIGLTSATLAATYVSL